MPAVACGHEDVQQAVGLRAHELGALVGQVDDDGDAAGPDGAQFGSHDDDVTWRLRPHRGGLGDAAALPSAP